MYKHISIALCAMALLIGAASAQSTTMPSLGERDKILSTQPKTDPGAQPSVTATDTSVPATASSTTVDDLRELIKGLTARVNELERRAAAVTSIARGEATKVEKELRPLIVGNTQQIAKNAEGIKAASTTLEGRIVSVETANKDRSAELKGMIESEKKARESAIGEIAKESKELSEKLTKEVADVRDGNAKIIAQNAELHADIARLADGDALRAVRLRFVEQQMDRIVYKSAPTPVADAAPESVDVRETPLPRKNPRKNVSTAKNGVDVSQFLERF